MKFWRKAALLVEVYLPVYGYEASEGGSYVKVNRNARSRDRKQSWGSVLFRRITGLLLSALHSIRIISILITSFFTRKSHLYRLCQSLCSERNGQAIKEKDTMSSYGEALWEIGMDSICIILFFRHIYIYVIFC